MNGLIMCKNNLQEINLNTLTRFISVKKDSNI